MGDSADLLMPKLGLTMTEGTVARWLVAPGERFSAGDIIVVIETDKIANDIEAPASGEMTAHLSSEGDVVPIGTPIAKWRLEGTDTRARAISEAAPQPAAVDRPDGAPRAAVSPANSRSSAERIVATPYARRLAREAGLDLAHLAGTGPRGRIKAVDVLHAKEARPTSRQLAPIPLSAEPAPRSPAPLTSSSFISADVDVSALRTLDARLAGARDRPFGRLTYLALACTKALASDSDEPVRLGFESNRSLAVFECTASDTLSAMAARSAHAQPATGNGDIAIFMVEGRARLLVPALPPGWRMALGVGGVRSVRGGEATHQMTLALTYDASDRDHTSAAQVLDRIAALLEEPLHLLAI
jgi:pyruvate dehydrogenase E2 component (dihydrolipoamide acetyltransferase)